ncbi:hypothetical protein [Niabella hibiscisoli]|uniref:hypothetical protein n=1 Tax=Niabella hibiscisoli TaxID=1825928 RepID=UPI001F0EA1C3|nr:hypothetical protein [Niabella hibiscisoli]MCH5719949.1 hypothetical protein [Niabella hibiscisoli]
MSNIIEGCVSGIVLWNNYGQPQIIRSNKISNKNLTSKVNPILYTSAPILLIGYNSNNGSIIENNIITVTKIERNSYMPKQLLSITSSNVKLLNNIFVDSSQSLRAFIGQGKSSNEIVTNIEFSGNQLQCLEFITSDAEALTVQNNKFVSKFGAFLFKDKATGSSSKKISKSVIKNNVFAVEKSLNVNGDTIDRTLNKFIK